MSSKGKPGIPENVMGMLAAADKRNGFPPGTMASVMQQEVGGDINKYLADPSTYHYGLNAEGKRVAGHTGKVSTAFGPFGILESTGADPGYGVKPLANKSLDEQVRFAADYLAARAKAGGSLEAGLAGYGEGAKYSGQVMARMAPSQAPVARNQAPIQSAQVAQLGTFPVQPAPEAPVLVASSPAQPVPEMVAEAAAAAAPQQVPMNQSDAWQEFLRTVQGARQPINVADLDFGNPQMQVATKIPQFQYQPVDNLRPNFEAFGSWGRRQV